VGRSAPILHHRQVDSRRHIDSSNESRGKTSLQFFSNERPPEHKVPTENIPPASPATNALKSGVYVDSIGSGSFPDCDDQSVQHFAP